MDSILRQQIQQVTLDCFCYGYRRVTHELMRQGIRVNHKRVLRLMREDNLLCLRKKRFVATTGSDHGLPVYPNLAAEMDITALTRRSEKPVADLNRNPSAHPSLNVFKIFLVSLVEYLHSTYDIRVDVLNPALAF